jgi:YjbE family integral membrane protein
MELFSAAWFSGLLAIILIDLVLAGDNAIVIALAARRLPSHLQKRAIIWGTVGAIVVRTVMTIGVVWLLRIPGLMLLGGLGLVWIAYKLLAPGGEGHAEEAGGPNTFWGAMKTIVIADALMGIDNVLGVAGAAKGAFDLVVIGLLISVPIVVWGSTLVLKLVDRFPIITYLGAGVLAYTAAHMIIAEPLLDPVLDPYLIVRVALYAVVVVGVLAAGWFASKRAAARAQQEAARAEKNEHPQAAT